MPDQSSTIGPASTINLKVSGTSIKYRWHISTPSTSTKSIPTATFSTLLLKVPYSRSCNSAQCTHSPGLCDGYRYSRTFFPGGNTGQQRILPSCSGCTHGTSTESTPIIHSDLHRSRVSRSCRRPWHGNWTMLAHEQDGISSFYNIALRHGQVHTLRVGTEKSPVGESRTSMTSFFFKKPSRRLLLVHVLNLRAFRAMLSPLSISCPFFLCLLPFCFSLRLFASLFWRYHTRS